MTSSGTTSDPVPLDAALLAPHPRTLDDVHVKAYLPGFWCLRIPLPFGPQGGPVPFDRPRFVNCYLLEDQDGFVLVDCGPSTALGWEGLARAIALTGAPLSAVHTLLLTHLHADHASLAQVVVDRLGCRLWRSRGPDASLDRLRDPLQPFADRREWARREGVPAADFALLDIPIAHDGSAVRPVPDRLLDPGDVVRTRLGDWRVHAAPGHSCTQIALVESSRGWCISADAVYEGAFTYLEYGRTPNPLQEDFTTLRQLGRLGLTRIFAGHGPPNDDPPRRIAGADASFRRTLDQHRAILSVAEPLSGYEIACRTTEGSPDPDQRGSALATALAIAEYLVIEGEAQAHRDPDDDVRRFRLIAERPGTADPGSTV